MSKYEGKPDLLRFTSDIVAAQLGKTPVATTEIPKLIAIVHQALLTAGSEKAPVPPKIAQPAVPVKKSVFPDYLVCLEDGKQVKTLKRHLRTAFGLTPDEYRRRWGLPKDYPMVAPNYAKQRSAMAKSFGLGRVGSHRPK